MTPCLEGDVPARPCRGRQPAKHRGDVQDPAPGGEKRRRFPRQAEDRGQVGRQDGVPARVVRVRERRGPAQARAVDEDVDAAPLRDGRRDRVGNREGQRHVAADREGLSPGADDLLGDPAAGDLVPRPENNPCALGREPPRDGLADPARGAGHEGDLSLEPARGTLRLLGAHRAGFYCQETGKASSEPDGGGGGSDGNPHGRESRGERDSTRGRRRRRAGRRLPPAGRIPGWSRFSRYRFPSSSFFPPRPFPRAGQRTG
jgi:hypothetical protein